MDPAMIGAFLASLRKAHGFSQEELGEKIGVSNKTVSRWETGKYLPPADMLMALSTLYDVSINELLSGKRLEANDYKQQAEANLQSILKNNPFPLSERVAFFKHKWAKEHLPGTVWGLILAAAVIAAGVYFDNGLQLLGAAAAIAWSTLRYNQMMIYVEHHAYDGTGPGENEQEPLCKYRKSAPASYLFRAGAYSLGGSLLFKGCGLLSDALFAAAVSLSGVLLISALMLYCWQKQR